MFRNKRGDVTDIMLIVVIVIFLAISFIVVIFVNTKIKDVITTTGMNDTEAADDIVTALDKVNNTTVQRGFMLMFGLLIIGTLVSSFLVRVHPAFLFLAIIMLMFTVLVAVIGQTVYNKVADVESFSTIATQQTMINTIMERLVTISIVVGALSFIILFGKLVIPSAVGGSDV